jgi:hypothetical protein
MGTSERNGALAGIVFFALIVGAIVLFSGTPGSDDSPSKFASYYADDGHQTKAYASALLGALGGIAFLWFLGALRSVLFRWETPPGQLTALVFAGGIVGVALQEASTAVALAYPSAVDFYDKFPDNGQLAMLLGAVSYWLAGFAAVGGTVMAGAFAAAVFRSGAFPRWLGWVSVVVALAQLVSLVFGVTGLLFLPWVALIAIVMLRGGGALGAPTPPAADVRPAG